MYAVQIIFSVKAKVDIFFPLQEPNFFKQINVMEDHQHNDLPTFKQIRKYSNSVNNKDFKPECCLKTFCY